MRSLLTLPGVFGDSGVPQTVIGVTDAFPVPHTLFPPFFVLKSQNCEIPMLHFFLSNCGGCS